MIMVKLKGLGVLDCREYITEKFGLDAHNKIKAQMKKADADLVYSTEILPVSWVSLDAVIAHLLTFDRVFGNGNGKAADDMLRHVGAKHYKGIYSIAFKGMSPKEILQKVAAIWERFYDHGKNVLDSIDNNNAVVKIVDCPDLPLHHERLPIPYMETILSLSGAKNTRITHPQCVAKGAEYCILKYRWG
jgi:hypothetical protein